MPDNYISRIKLSNGSYVLIKDSKAQSDISTLLGSHALTVLGSAAWEPVASSITASGVPSASVVKDYVDAQVGSINKFDIVVCEADATKIPAGAVYKNGGIIITGTMPASADTMYKIYLVKDDSIQDGVYSEWISIRSGTDPNYTYAWEKIGSTAADFDDYVKKTTKIAGISLDHDITVSELQVALKLAGFAYADTGTGYVSTIDSIEMASLTVSGDISISSTATSATISRADYQPSGTITGNVSAPTISLTKSTVTYVTGINKGNAVTAAINGVTVSVNTSATPGAEDYETLVFWDSSTHSVMDYSASATTTTFDNVTGATAATPTFGGTFTGSTVTGALVTGVTYDKASGDATFEQIITPTVSAYNRSTKTITVVPNVTATTTVTPPASV